IAYYHNALRIRTESDFPQDWAQTQNNLANAYNNRIAGDKRENLENAIAYYHKALRIYTESDFPQDWATTQNNLANAYLYRIAGDKRENLEMAIAYYHNALRIRTESDFPQDWAQTQNNLANAYNNRIAGDKRENLENAIALYHNALRIYTPANFPIDCFKSSFYLGKLGWDNGNWELAIEGYEIAIKAVEQSRNWVIDEQRREEILKESIIVYERIIQAYLNIGEVGKALAYTERFRCRGLADLMASSLFNQGGEIDPKVQPLLIDYEDLQKRINTLRFGSQTEANLVLAGSRQLRDGEELEKYKEEIANLTAQKQEVWKALRKLDPVLAGQIEVEYLSLEQMWGLVENKTTALLSFYTTREDTHIFILRNQESGLSEKLPQVYTCQGQGWEVLQKWIFENWFKPYIGDNGKWLEKMGDFLAEVAQRLELNRLISQHLMGIEELIIVPHLYLHQMPFAALPVGGVVWQRMG
ncbi:tetratricopeptide repeat protein, partial [Limnofasciculus baicalensis]